MNIKIHSSELNRMLKVINQCTSADRQELSNIEIGHNDNLLTIRATDGVTAAIMSAPVLGGDGEKFCVDGDMFSKVVGMCNGEVSIISDDKFCTVKGAGRTRLPIVKATIPSYDPVNGKKLTINAGDFTKCFNSVAYAIASDQSRVVLTGAYVTASNGKMMMVALDGFQMAIESTSYVGDDATAVISKSFMKLLSSNTAPSEQISITINNGRVQAETDGMLIATTLLSGDYPDFNRMLPQSFVTEIMVNATALRDALKCGSVANNGNNLITMVIENNTVSIRSNSEQADFEGNIPCEISGDQLTISFNQKYLISTIGAVDTENVIIKFNSAISPCIAHGQNENGIHLVLPVRTRG